MKESLEGIIRETRGHTMNQAGIAVDKGVDEGHSAK
jgi:hypothetical protein